MPGLVHGYPDKALFLGNFELFQGCPLNSPSERKQISVLDLPSILSFVHKIVRAETESHIKLRFLPIWKRWGKGFPYVEKTPTVQDIVVSGGDSF